MVAQHDDEGFGGCTNIGECAAVCPKQIPLDVISQLNRDLIAVAVQERRQGRVQTSDADGAGPGGRRRQRRRWLTPRAGSSDSAEADGRVADLGCCPVRAGSCHRGIVAAVRLEPLSR